jgi:YVTN family beta-propeller protein
MADFHCQKVRSIVKQFAVVKRAAVWSLAALMAGSICSFGDDRAPTPGKPAQADEPNLLITGRAISPESAASTDVGSIPINMISVREGKFAVCTDIGFRQFLWTIRTDTGAGVSKLPFPNRGTTDKTNGLYYGLACSADGTLYAAQGNHDSIAVLKVDEEGNLSHQGSIAARKADFPSGLALDRKGHLYVANHDPQSRGLPVPSSMSIYDAASEKEIGRFAFSESFGGLPNFPLAIAALNDGGKCYVASERDGIVYALNTADPSHITQAAAISTGLHPLALLLDKAQKRLFVANAHSDTISVVDTSTDKVTSTILLRPTVVRDIVGATPTGLALSGDEKWLYVTLGDMNAVALVDVKDNEVEAYVPAGWYPTSVIVSPDGKRLLVSNAKGTKLRNPNPRERQQNPINILEGNVLSVDVPAKARFKELSQKVLINNRLTADQLSAANPLASIGLQAGKIKHVIYIVKENRTYDQVLGDMTQGNGEPKYCIFGKDITPNLHALAERFVLLDNFYDCGEVSGDGWTWSTQAMANAFTIRNVPYEYSNRGHVFDYEGEVDRYPAGGFSAKDPDGKPTSASPVYKGGGKAIPDVSEAPGGHLWDLARKHGLSYRNYGFFVGDGAKGSDGKQITPFNWPDAPGLLPPGHDLEGITDIDFRRFDTDYADSDAGKIYYEQTHDARFLWTRAKFGKYGALSRFEEWNREFQMMLAKDPTGESVPNFITLRLGDDHTAGLSSDRHSPRGMAADNDFAVGQVVQTLSKSPIWKSTAIFVIEDDAQAGADHVDAHRSICFVISPWIKKNSVDHAFHNTVSCIRTMELIMGLPPMCQYDATARPMMDWDSSASNDAPYVAIMPSKALAMERNPKASTQPFASPEQRAAAESDAMDFAKADHAPVDRLNLIIWQSVRGWNSQPPKSPHTFNPLGTKIADDDDD